MLAQGRHQIPPLAKPGWTARGATEFKRCGAALTAHEAQQLSDAAHY